eukprot:COSAG05_NODE_7414_length_813_cov_2.310924_1_plen_117_part_00
MKFCTAQPNTELSVTDRAEKWAAFAEGKFRPTAVEDRRDSHRRADRARTPRRREAGGTKPGHVGHERTGIAGLRQLLLALRALLPAVRARLTLWARRLAPLALLPLQPALFQPPAA